MKRTILFALSLLLSLCLGACASFKMEDSLNTEGAPSTENSGGAESEGSDGNSSDDAVGEEYCQVIFDSAGGTAVASQRILSGEKIVQPNAPNKENDSRYEYSFDGWYLGDYKWNFETDTVSEDITLTAKWKIESEFTNPFLPSD